MAGLALTFVGSDDVAIGYKVANALMRALRGRGRIVALDGTPSAPTARDRDKGLRQALAEHPGVELLAGRVGFLQRAPARQAMADLLAAHPEIDGVWTANDNDGVRRSGRARCGGAARWSRRSQRTARGDCQYPARRDAGHG